MKNAKCKITFYLLLLTFYFSKGVIDMSLRICSSYDGFRRRRHPSQIQVILSRKMVEIKGKFTRLSNEWRYLTLEQIERWEKWVKGQTHYKNARSAFIGLNMVAQSCGIQTTRLNT